MSETNQRLLQLTASIKDDPANSAIVVEWYDLASLTARNFIAYQQRNRWDKKDIGIVMNDSVSRLWEKVMVKNIPIRKSITSMLWYEVLHCLNYRTKKDYELSYDEILERKSKRAAEEFLG